MNPFVPISFLVNGHWSGSRLGPVVIRELSWTVSYQPQHSGEQALTLPGQHNRDISVSSGVSEPASKL